MKTKCRNLKIVTKYLIVLQIFDIKYIFLERNHVNVYCCAIILSFSTLENPHQMD